MVDSGPLDRDEAAELSPAARQRLREDGRARVPELMRVTLAAAVAGDPAALARAAQALASDARRLELDELARTAGGLARAAAPGDSPTGALLADLARAYAAARPRLAGDPD